MSKSRTRRLAGDVKERIIGYLTAALGLIAGLAWNEAVKELITVLFPFGQNSLLAKTIYALLVTILVVIIGIYLARLSSEEAENK